MDSTYILCCVLQAFRKRKYLHVNVVCENQKYKQNRRQKQQIPTSGQQFSLFLSILRTVSNNTTGARHCGM